MFASAGLSPGQTCGLVLIFAVLVQSICVAITFLYFTNELQQLRETYSKSSFACFTRDNFFLEDLDPSYNEDSDPCWQVKWQLSRLIKKMISKNYVEKTAATAKGGKLRGPTTAERETVENSVPRVAAHLTANRRSALVRQNSSSKTFTGIKINTWETSRGAHSFLYNVDLRNGELIIPQTGFYYIYSQTYFRFREPDGVLPDAEPDSDSVRNPKQMVQYIYKFTNYPEPILLMKSARTSCWSKQAGYGLYSIYQGGVFQLKENDRIFVSINNKDLVDLDNEGHPRSAVNCRLCTRTEKRKLGQGYLPERCPRTCNTKLGNAIQMLMKEFGTVALLTIAATPLGAVCENCSGERLLSHGRCRISKTAGNLFPGFTHS